MLENVKRTRLDQALDAVNTAVLIIVILLIAYPLLFVVIASLSDPVAIYNDPLRLWPAKVNFESYKAVFDNKDIWQGFFNSILYTTIGTLVNIVMTTLAAYPLSRRDFYGKSAFTFYFVFTMFFSGGLIPSYLINKQLHLLDTFWVMVLPMAMSVYNAVIMRTYFQTNIPQELEESAHVDGCNDFQILYKIVLPLSVPIIAVLVLFYGVGHWNSYFHALVYLQTRDQFPLQLILREILVQNQFKDMVGATMVDERFSERMAVMEGIKYAVVIVSSLPLLVIYPMMSRFFKKGILIGSLKG
ncbi:carbohydrate ABC transporter permease [Paenibacillus arenilitoris]|uniref:Carbohydrate ABC transporter permease n=1 Tax=Paenibacillus arenilitoris TaxID=2772299 RepID=A0A927CI09_9BACL|nr:carbohydrate ABC transporter permease [Paenibacillus arenilitoris]MBD2867870.1 carbohydrate ABC transporter permease [Paenibacillus arenilitoris]